MHVETALVNEDEHTVNVLAAPHAATAGRDAGHRDGGLRCWRCWSPRRSKRRPIRCVTPNPAKAPWYFLWLQELVTDTTIQLGGFTINGALIGGILVPGVLVLLLAVWPYLDKSPGTGSGRVVRHDATPAEPGVPRQS